jgi:hypothetical protein
VGFSGLCVSLNTPTPRINPGDWIQRVALQVQPAAEANRIGRNKSPDIRIIEAKGVVVQPRVAIKVLPLEAQVLFDG